MRFSILPWALLSAITVSAHPVSSCIDDSDGRAATLFSGQNLVCGGVTAAYTPIPADASCFPLSNLFGSWEGKTRSLVVAKGFKCDFYTDSDCPSTSTPLCVGKGAEVVLKTLPKLFDSAIQSVKCTAL